MTTVAVLAAAVPMTSALAGSATDRATGGGQILVGDKGAGDTIAFTARGTSAAATGQVQYVDRVGGIGKDQTTYHGTVSCLNVMGNVAKIGGTFRDGSQFTILVVDNGQGSAAEADTISYQKTTDPSCGRKGEDNDAKAALARGNAQVYDASATK